MKKIIVLTDFSRVAGYAANVALDFATSLGYDLVLVNSYLMPFAAWSAEGEGRTLIDAGLIASQSETGLDKEAKRLRIRANKVIQQRKPDITILSSIDTIGNALRLITANSEIAMIVVGTHHTHMPNIFSAVDLTDILNEFKCPLFIVPNGKSIFPLKDIVFASDMGEDDLDTISNLSSFGRALAFRIHVCHVSTPSIVADFNLENRLLQFVHAVTGLENSHISFSELKGTNFAKTIDNFGTEIGAGAIALIYRPHSVLWKLFHSSHTGKLLRYKSLPLLILPSNLK